MFLLTEGAQGFRLVTHPRLARWVRVLRDEPPPVKLSQSAMETLAVIAYRQPVTRAEIEHIRGVSAEAGLPSCWSANSSTSSAAPSCRAGPSNTAPPRPSSNSSGARSLDELPASDVLSRRQIDDWLQSAMRATHPSDRDMGLAEEGEEQLSLDDAARARGDPGTNPAADPPCRSRQPAPAGGTEPATRPARSAGPA